MSNAAPRLAALVAALATAIAIVGIGCGGDAPASTDDAAPRADAQQQRGEPRQQAAPNAPPDRFIAVSAGWEHTCGLRESGAIECWGYNLMGQADAPSGRFSAVSAGNWHTCGLRDRGEIVCWGAVRGAKRMR